MTDPSLDDLRQTLAITADDLAAKVREAVLASNADGAERWASALRDAASSYRELLECESHE